MGVTQPKFIYKYSPAKGIKLGYVGTAGNSSQIHSFVGMDARI